MRKCMFGGSLIALLASTALLAVLAPAQDGEPKAVPGEFKTGCNPTPVEKVIAAIKGGSVKIHASKAASQPNHELAADCWEAVGDAAAGVGTT